LRVAWRQQDWRLLLMDPRQEQLCQRLGALGFDAVRFASVTTPLRNGLAEWLGAGMQADMDWMARTAEESGRNPDLVLPGRAGR